ncbi:TPA: hypothetical protein DD394_05505 [bacterium UBP9_UBA11836]|nr:hypothetical protein [bacterium UBP9_UBA11836]
MLIFATFGKLFGLATGSIFLPGYCHSKTNFSCFGSRVLLIGERVHLEASKHGHESRLDIPSGLNVLALYLRSCS